MVKCEECKKHEATIDFAADVSPLAISHGQPIIKLCLCCYTKKVEENYRNVQAYYKTIKQRLKKEGCKDDI